MSREPGMLVDLVLRQAGVSCNFSVNSVWSESKQLLGGLIKELVF